MLGINNSLIILKGSCGTLQTIATWQDVWRWRFSYNTEKNSKLNAKFEFLKDRKEKNQFEKLDFKNLFAKIYFIWH